MTLIPADPTGRILVEVRSHPLVLAILGSERRVTVGEASMVKDPRTGKNLPKPPPFVILRTFPRRRFAGARVPVQRHQYMALCYGKEKDQASQLSLAVEHAIQNLTPRVNASRVGIYNSYADVGGQYQTDPDTQWPFEMVIFSVNAAAVLLTEVS